MIPHPSDRQARRGSWSPAGASALACFLLLSCDPPPPKEENSPSQEPAAERALAVADGDEQNPPFRDITASSGVDFVHWNGRSGGFFYSEMMGSGAALFDVDQDGDLDLFLVQGTQLDVNKTPSVPEPAHGLGDRLYRNDLEIAEDGSRSLRFVDISAEAGLDTVERGYGMGVAVTDIDNDGFPDLYITRAGANQLLRHRGGATPVYEDITDEITGLRRWAVPVLSFDVEGDGDLDLFLGHYVDYSIATDKRCTDELGQPNYCGPLAYPSVADELLINLGPGADGRPRFEAAGGRAGFASAFGPALGATLLDLELDGRLDIFVANDGNANQLWHNLGAGRFEDKALELGVAVNGQGHAEAGMGVASGDIDNDGDEDLLVTHLTRETHTLYTREENLGAGPLAGFLDRTSEAGLGQPSFALTGFGTGFMDIDHDGLLDAVAVSGAVKVIKELALAGDPYPLHQKNLLLRGVGEGRFEKWSTAIFESSEVSRGAAIGDLDNDGDLDLVITNNSGPTQILENRLGQDHPWLGISLVDSQGFPVPGAYAELEFEDGSRRVRRVGANSSYASGGDPRLHFTWGEDVASPIREIRVLWPGGLWESFAAPAPNTYHQLQKGQGANIAPTNP